MTTLSVAAGAAPRPARRTPFDLDMEIADDLASVEPVWRELEAHGVATPYGRFDWVSAFASAETKVKVAICRDPTGRPALILPIATRRQGGLAIGSGIGGKHANFNLPVMRTEVAQTLDPPGARALLVEIGRRLRLDAFAFVNVPVAWDGRDNPFAAGGTPAASDVWGCALERDGEATLRRTMKGEARKKLRNKARGLAKLGPVAVVRARTVEDVERMLGAFLRQKEDRFRELGIADPFADPAMQGLLRTASVAGLERDRPAVELYGLEVAGRFVAILGGAADERRFSGMFVSFEPGEVARFSPGEILSTELLQLQCARGRTSFDLGVGEARYKRASCDRVEPLVDLVVPVTAAGHLYGLSRALLVGGKRRIKASPHAMAALGRLRRIAASLRGGASRPA